MIAYGIGQTIIFLSCAFFFLLLGSPYVIGQTIYIFILSFVLLLSSFFFFLALSQLPQIGCLPYFHTWCGLSANLRCRPETCCKRLAENAGRKEVAKNRHLGTVSQLCWAMSSYLRHVSTIGKKLLSSNMFSRCSHNTVNFGPLAAEIGLGVWGTPTNFNGFRVLAALLHGTPAVGSAKLCGIQQRAPPIITKRPSRWALAHILVDSVT